MITSSNLFAPQTYRQMIIECLLYAKHISQYFQALEV